MTSQLRLGIIGAGAMGTDHARTIHRSIPAARVAGIHDVDPTRAKGLAAELGGETASSAEELIESSDIDALIVASPDPTHAPLANAAIAAGKVVLSEKPLGVSPEESLSVVEAEMATGRRFITVGFMRRFDPGYVALKQLLVDDELGEARLVHNIHRNQVGHPSATTEGIVVNSMIHELDVVPWLLDSQISWIEVMSPVAEGFRDPQLATVGLASDALATIEVFVNAAYGYDVRCEIVGTCGAASLVPPATTAQSINGVSGQRVPSDFRRRFKDAYRLELDAWTLSILDGELVGPTAWDGHLANLVAAAGVASLHGGGRVEIETPAQPELYA